MRRIKPLKKILLGVSSFFLIFIAGTKSASAFVIPVAIGAVAWFSGIFNIIGEGVAETLINYIVDLISKIILFVGEIFLRIAAWLMEVGIDLNAQVADSPIIKEGYNIALSVANIALVIAIIIVAFMVMLRRPSANQLLFRFIAVALIINFGFYIMINILIKPVDNITVQIFDAINVHPEGGFYSTFGQSLLTESIDPEPVLADALEAEGQKVPATEEEFREQLFGSGNLILTLSVGLAKVIFIGVAEFVLIITMFAYAFMFLARYVALSFFIILFPLAVVFWMFPNLKMADGNLWNQWFEGFTRWLLFAPIGLFFVWLAVRIVTGTDVVQPATDDGIGIFLATVGNMVVVVGFLLGGLMVANKMSITGASVAQGLVKKAGKGVQGYAKKQGLKGVTAPLRTKTGRRATEAVQKFGQRNKFTRTLTAPTRNAATAVANFRRKGEALYKEDKKDVDKMKLEEQVRQVSGMSSSRRLVVLTNLREARHSAIAMEARADQRVQNITPGMNIQEQQELHNDLARRQQQIDVLDDMIAEMPLDIATSFEDLERAYGEHETPMIKKKPKKDSDAEGFEDIKSAPPAGGGGGTP